MTAAQRDELLKRVEKDDPSEKLSFKECGKIAKDLNLTLEQVIFCYDLLTSLSYPFLTVSIITCYAKINISI